MVKVLIWGSLRAFTEGRGEIEIEATTLRGLLEGITRAYPGTRPQIERGVSVSIDGRIHNDDWFAPIRPDSEVVLLPRITGG